MTIYLLALLPVGALATFEATNNWQPVEQDEQLPPGIFLSLLSRTYDGPKRATGGLGGPSYEPSFWGEPPGSLHSDFRTMMVS
jgi:hypothetical protein